MQTALQAQQVCGSHSAPSSKRSERNNPDGKIRLTGSHLVEMFHALSSTLLPEGPVFNLTKVEEIPMAVRYHSDLAIPFREKGDVDAYFRHAQLAALLKKVEFPLFEDKCQQVALDKWYDAEAACRDMNEKCADILAHPYSTKHVELKRQLDEMRQELENLLGKEPPSLLQLSGRCGFGPGADSTHRRTEGHAAFKMLHHSALTTQNLEELEDVFPNLMVSGGNPAIAAISGIGSSMVSFESARLEFVPKTCEEHRTIEIMPSLATFVAKGYDSFIRSRLVSEWNVDLTAQTPNRHLAFLGSLEDSENSPVTLDLSSASDRISMGLVRLVLPIQWSRALFPLRSRDVIMPDGTVQSLNKFASMGNSLTFSLQTAIYGAIIVRAYRAAGLRWKKWRAYGDDLIVIKSIAPRVIADLERVGFKLNMEKSFISGPFRESCGHDYLRGHNVRPFYIKKPIRLIADLFKTINSLQIIAIRSPIPVSSYRGLLQYLLKLVPKPFRLVGNPAHGLETCIWSPIRVVPKGILKAREVSFKVPDWVAYRTTLLNGAGESKLISMKSEGKILSLRKEKDFYSPSQLLTEKRQLTLERAAIMVGSVMAREPVDIPTGIKTFVKRRPGLPGLSPLTDDECRKLFVPIW